MADGQKLAIYQREWISQKESAVAPKKSEDATIEDLEQRLETDGHKPQLAHGLAIAAEDVHFQGRVTDYLLAEFHERKIKFLLSFFGEYDESTLAEKIYVKVIEQLLEDSWLLKLVEERPTPLQRLIDFLGQNPPVGGIKEKVRKFLAEIVHQRFVGYYADRQPALLYLSWDSITRALLRYQMLKTMDPWFAKNRVYEAIPALFEAVVKQVGEKEAHWIRYVARQKWDEEAYYAVHRDLKKDYDVAYCIARAFLLVGSDTRALRLLFDLSQAYISEHGKPYPLSDLDRLAASCSQRIGKRGGHCEAVVR